MPRWAPAARRAPAAHLPALRPEGPKGRKSKEERKRKKSGKKEKERRKEFCLPHEGLATPLGPTGLAHKSASPPPPAVLMVRSVTTSPRSLTHQPRVEHTTHPTQVGCGVTLHRTPPERSEGVISTCVAGAFSTPFLRWVFWCTAGGDGRAILSGEKP